MKPLIGITVGEIHNSLYPWGPMVYGQNYTYCEAVERAGAVPCLIPLMSDLKNLRLLYEKLGGILFAGGNDINPRLYGEKPYPTTVEISDRRDTIEVELIKWALQDRKPLLGICRGMQMLNVVCGGTLYQDIPTDIDTATDHTISTGRKNSTYRAHKLNVADSSKLADILKKTAVYANSHHHQAIKDIGAALKAVAWAEDGVIEAIESQDTAYVVGLQCHPESLDIKVVPEFRKLFESFAAASRS